MKNKINLIVLFAIVLQLFACTNLQKAADSVPATLAAGSDSLGTQKTYTISINNDTRSYIVFVPHSLPNEKRPVLFFLHGALRNAAHSVEVFGLNKLAAENKFIVVYPDGASVLLDRQRRIWNAGNCCVPPGENPVDDVAMIVKIANEIEKNYPVDKKRFYVTGMSNGGMMSYRLMCDQPDLFAAVISVAGTLTLDKCDGGEKVALMHLHGIKDIDVPFHGGVGIGPSKIIFPSAANSIRMLTTARKCKTPVTQTFSNGDVETRYDCSPNAPVVLRVLAEVEHDWPGTKRSKRKSKTNYNMNEELWNFAKEFSK